MAEGEKATSEGRAGGSGAKPGGDPEADRPGEEKAVGGKKGAMPKVDFSTFVLSLGTTALYQMGLVPDKQTGEAVEADLLVARQTVDTLEMIREKTRGNLEEDERKLIDSLLYELQMRFVEMKR